jgi:hypothetical protein
VGCRAVRAGPQGCVVANDTVLKTNHHSKGRAEGTFLPCQPGVPLFKANGFQDRPKANPPGCGNGLASVLGMVVT